MSNDLPSPEAPGSTEFSRLDQVCLLSSLALTEAAGAFTPEHSTSRYALLGTATLAFVKGAIGLVRAESEPSEPDPIVVGYPYDPFGFE